MTRMSTEALKPEDLRSEYSLDAFNFTTTDDIHPDEKMIGQDRAMKAMDFGLQIKKDGYNLYVSGIPGTGRNTTILKAVRGLALQEPVPDDICYLYHFEKTDEPKAVKLPRGMGSRFQEDMSRFIRDLEHDVRRAFDSDQYEKDKSEVFEKYENQKDDLNTELRDFAADHGFTIQKDMTGVLVVPVFKGHEMSKEDFERLDSAQKAEIKERQDEIYEKIYEISRKIKQIEKAFRREIKELDAGVGLSAIDNLIDDLKSQYAEFPVLIDHLNSIKADILANLGAFKKEAGTQLPFILEPLGNSREDILQKYQVNLLVDHRKNHGAPVIIEDNPTYYNLIGRVEHKAQLGVLLTDFSMIKAGAIHKADGGYLVIQARDLFKDYFAWDALKNIIKSKKVKIENMAERYGYIPTAGLKPEPVEVNVKVVLIGSAYIYYLLRMLDEEFRETFKVRVDFDTELDKTDNVVLGFISFLSRKCGEEKLLPLDKAAVQEIVNLGSRITSHKEKLTACFAEIVDVLREADFWARRSGQTVIRREDAKQAVTEKIFRSDRIEKKIRELFEEGTLIIDTEGEKTGQVNGISVIDLGDYAFGKPSRITARTYLGKGRILDIERETDLGGKIHAKGVLILSGFLGHKFAQNMPLALSASICFEQTYEEVEGDSASSAEMYCLLSSLGNIPLKQDIAVTGSVDQLGNIQAVGGINEKIEGWFEVCRIKGLKGQSVLIPKSNIRHLMLKDEVVQAVREGSFHVYPVRTIDEGIELLTGMEAGKRMENGQFSVGTVYYEVWHQLKQYMDVALQMNREDSWRQSLVKNESSLKHGATPPGIADLRRRGSGAKKD